MNLRHAMLARSLAGIALLLPWLNPFSGGPTPGVVPWLFSVFCAVCAWLLSDRLSVRVVATVWVAAAVISAVIGLLQFFDLARWLGQWVNHAQVGEAYANLRQRNQFATLTSIGLLAWLWLLSQRVRSQVFGKWGTDQAFVMLATIYVVLLAMGNAASGSRTGLLQWMFVLVLAIVWLHIPRDRGHDSTLMSGSIPLGWRTAFHTIADSVPRSWRTPFQIDGGQSSLF